jgi:hypothetical protein
MNESYKEALSKEIEESYRNLEERILQDIVRRIKATGKITSTADYLINRLLIIGNSTEDIENMVKDTLHATYPKMFELYDNVIEWEYVRSKEVYEQINAEFIPYEENGEVRQLTESLIRQSGEQLENVSKSLGFYIDYGNGKKVMTPIAQIYQKYLNDACMDIASGAFDYNTVLRRVVTQLTNSGLRTVDYASGHHNRVDVAARRAVMTGVAQLTGHISDMNAERLGTEYFEVAWHAGARPEHAIWQGKVYKKDDLYRICGMGTVTGLLGANCYHEYYPFFPGISQRNWSDEWLAEQNRLENIPREWQGREYTLYEAKQKQRKMETAMRAQREKVNALEGGGADKDDILLARCKYQAQLDEYGRFSRKMQLKQERERIYLDMRGYVATNTKKQNSRYTADMMKYADRDSKQFKKYENSLGKGAGTLARFRQMKYNNTEEYWLFQGYARAVEKGDVHALTGFELYKNIAKSVQENIVGITTSEGIEIKTYTTHFIDRVIGQTSTSHEGMRLGVPISDAREALINPVIVHPPKTMKDGDVRQKYSGKLASVVISITDNRLIQTTPRGGI